MVRLLGTVTARMWPRGARMGVVVGRGGVVDLG